VKIATVLWFTITYNRGVADGQVGPVLTGPLVGQSEIFFCCQSGVCVLASVQFDLDIGVISPERPTAVCQRFWSLSMQ